MNVELRGNVDATLRSQLEKAVTDYGAANTGVAHADGVRLEVIGPDGNPCQVEGAFQRDMVGNLIFIALGLVGRVLNEAADRLFKRDGRSPNARRAQRRERSKQQGAFAAIYNGALPDTPEERFAFLLGNDVIKKEGKGYAMSGGRTFDTKAKVLEHLAQLAPAAESGDTKNPKGGTPAAKAEGGKSAPATKATKRAATKAVKTAAKAARKAAKKKR